MSKETIKSVVKSSEFWLKLIIEALIIGVLIFSFQRTFDYIVKPLTAKEILKQQNLLNEKKEVYVEAIKLINRHIAYLGLYAPDTKPVPVLDRNIGSKYPNENEVNSCFSKICIYSEDNQIPKLFNEIFDDKDPLTHPMKEIEDFVNLLRLDLGYGKSKKNTDSYLYEYIQIKKRD